MIAYVVLEYSPRCPRCDAALKVLRRICDELDVPLIVRRVGSEAPALGSRLAYHPTSVQHTFTEEFARSSGDLEAASAIRGLREAGLDPSALTPTPVIRIVVAGPKGRRELLIRGFPLGEGLRQAYANLYALLRSIAGATE
ncbi:MAG: hypothetical protein DRJ67_09705 [Thermoprotei archaeon]|nr:MAG: hypothetical protein DRJ67_09705 [Thermoprotei archaeon]